MGHLKAIFRVTLLLIGLLAGWVGTAVANNEAVRFSENVNLSLRRTVHQLLRANGDSISAIPPITQADANTFSVRMEHMFDYDKLPQLLQQSFDAYHLDRPYSVTVLDCDSGEVRLGYQFLDLKQPGGVPCQSRARAEGCYVLQVRFTPETTKAKSVGNAWLFVSFGGTLAALGFIAWNRSRHKKVREAALEHAPVPDSRLAFGHSWLDITNQLLYNSKTTQTLTFREAKLLALFVRNANQVLERDLILKSVWEDEGVTVGRSVDVFVSRLRKLLAPDTQVKITAIHGVGYKMEVHS
ncbi:helix-turn-helix domain-containing protein [Dyadobacter sp. CY261]|uniref:helix-turn-helix domain-containing protein n=1 Tax=Dyadobacter sp. CY261 TaxID=2907203 RepID=UPI001F1A1118|nr:helix-turn-helix domain-containing protein [Dyadobacter sp. CY261]MCF0073298.1 helix-turn-helix domain-containing protein [Dyadobacter sp. CY261]